MANVGDTDIVFRGIAQGMVKEAEARFRTVFGARDESGTLHVVAC